MIGYPYVMLTAPRQSLSGLIIFMAHTVPASFITLFFRSLVSIP